MKKIKINCLGSRTRCRIWGGRGESLSYVEEEWLLVAVMMGCVL